jgi:hypothetical protein
MDERLRTGIEHFNNRQFFRCHEVLEGLYQDTDPANKPFLEALVQLAAAFRLFSDFGEVSGPVRMIHQTLVRFEQYQPEFLQVKVQELSALLEEWASQARHADVPPPITSIPKIPVQRSGFFS